MDEIAPPTTSSLPRIRIDWIFGVAATFLIFVVIATYSSRMARDGGDYDQQRRTERLDILAKQRASDQQTLTTADWVDATKNIVRIPIDEALPETVTALKTKPVQMGAALPGALPINNTVPAAAPNSAPAGSVNANQGTNAAPAAPSKPTATAPNK